MEVVYHPLVRADVEAALTYYRKISGWLADEFHAELRDIVNHRIIHLRQSQKAYLVRVREQDV